MAHKPVDDPVPPCQHVAMLEPMVQDYVSSAMQLDRQAFCDRVKVAVLVWIKPSEDSAFQSASTKALDDWKQGPGVNRSPDLEHQAKVIELASMRQKRIEQITIGRSEENDVVLQDETISSIHAIFLRHPKTAEFLIQEQESTNGSTLNGRPLVAYRSTKLNDGDALTFGDTAFLFFSPGGLHDAIKQMIGEK